MVLLNFSEIQEPRQTLASFRLLAFSLFISTIFLVPAYNADLTSYISTRTTEIPFEDLDELAYSNLGYQLMMHNDTVFYRLVQVSLVHNKVYTIILRNFSN